ncbi:acetolactate synthase small subunit [Phaeodactylibacter luteus]|uniref:Acetolactate synthase small subunit n=1 Tax=Phaeodactylibacter luteus TaxID=1564516 RepID=A0A5C6RGJ6_9BACT|nr:acetolactate synthase small subunit [Phaeodactylibacter luteus]TXB60558.1 acetolactate synthase small subunit [Phaeodactylibacter luteus]
METKQYTITVFTENLSGLMARVVSVFSRRHINIESLTTSQSSLPDIHRFTIVVEVTEEMVRKLVAQLEKQIEVLKAFYYTADEIVYQEIALYKVPTHVFSNSENVEGMIRKHNARVLVIEPEYIVLEKTGHEDETQAFFEELQKIGIYEFVRSGRIAIVKPMERLNNYLRSLEEAPAEA